MRDREDNWGPWAENLSTGERLARVRSLRALCHARWGIEHPLTIALFRAESLSEARLDAALTVLNAVPSRDQRNLLSLFQSMSCMKDPDDKQKPQRSLVRRVS
jgi:hypothetical protein